MTIRENFSAFSMGNRVVGGVDSRMMENVDNFERLSIGGKGEKIKF